MRQETEPLAAPARPLPDFEAEQEVDFRRYGRAIAARWWLVTSAVAAGVIIGYLLSLGGGTLHRATATIYLGQPVGPTGSGANVQSLAANPSTVSQIVRSESVVRETAEEAGIPAQRLRGRISTRAVSGAATREGQVPLVEISVRGAAPTSTATAANALAAVAVERVSGYVNGKIKALEERIAEQEQELENIDRRTGALEDALAGRALSGAERIALVSVIGFTEQRRGEVLEDRSDALQLLSFAENVERGRVVSPAAAVKVDARSSRSSALVGGLIGLIAGAVLALLWEPLLRRRPIR
jgi:capsular polysaccharide biosynthesis protein